MTGLTNTCVNQVLSRLPRRIVKNWTAEGNDCEAELDEDGRAEDDEDGADDFQNVSGAYLLTVAQRVIVDDKGDHRCYKPWNQTDNISIVNIHHNFFSALAKVRDSS